MAAPQVIPAPDGDGVELLVHTQPGAGWSGVAGVHGQALKLRVTAPAREGRANQAVVDLVAELFGVRRRAVTLVSGASSRSKRLRIAGLDVAGAQAVLDRLVAGRPRGTPAAPPIDP